MIAYCIVESIESSETALGTQIVLLKFQTFMDNDTKPKTEGNGF